MREIDVDFFSLQKGDPAESEIRHREIEYWPRANFYNFSNDIKDFSDTAALIANLDLVVSVDTSTAHLAAALGKPTWILNRFDTCWRWLLDRDDTPWYPSVKLYRQDDRENWEPVLHRAAGDLTKLANMHRSAC
jgi:Glycosyltransferase family 9 (heptosyltransferase)